MGYLIYYGLLLLSMLVLVTIFAFTMSKTDGKKTVWFTGLLIFAFFSLLGIFMAVISTTAEGAFNGKRIEQLGAYFLGPMVLFFIAEYCEIKIHKALRVILMGLSMILVVLVWTTQSHGLIYASFEYSQFPTNGPDNAFSTYLLSSSVMEGLFIRIIQLLLYGFIYPCNLKNEFFYQLAHLHYLSGSASNIFLFISYHDILLGLSIKSFFTQMKSIISSSNSSLTENGILISRII